MQSFTKINGALREKCGIFYQRNTNITKTEGMAQSYKNRKLAVGIYGCVVVGKGHMEGSITQSGLLQNYQLISYRRHTHAHTQRGRERQRDRQVEEQTQKDRVRLRKRKRIKSKTKKKINTIASCSLPDYCHVWLYTGK